MRPTLHHHRHKQNGFGCIFKSIVMNSELAHFFCGIFSPGRCLQGARVAFGYLSTLCPLLNKWWRSFLMRLSFVTLAISCQSLQEISLEIEPKTQNYSKVSSFSLNFWNEVCLAIGQKLQHFSPRLADTVIFLSIRNADYLYRFHLVHGVFRLTACKRVSRVSKQHQSLMQHTAA